MLDGCFYGVYIIMMVHQENVLITSFLKLKVF